MPTKGTLPARGGAVARAPGGDDPGSADSVLREVVALPDMPVGGELTPLRFTPGEIVSSRFAIERLAGSGGMGTVYRALDRVTGGPVALKVMSDAGQHEDRFAREVQVLAQLQHPAIVRYVAHGSAAFGQPYLAMEWLEGVDLSHRLAHAGLSVPESLEIARRLAEGLAVAHARGVIHRDVKPSNVLLVEGDPARATLLDFGIVQIQLALGGAPPLRTQTGTILGTVGYMSPEQAIADRQLDARVDVFALGCVLFECLTGRPAFSGQHVAAVLAKVLREEAPRVRDLRPELPASLDDLVMRMLAKNRAARPADGAAVLAELLALGDVTGAAPVCVASPSVGLSSREQRLVVVLLARVPDSPAVAEIVRQHAGEPARLANGALLVTLGSRTATAEQTVSIADCALELHERFPPARIALALGRARVHGNGTQGPTIDRAASLLAESTSAGVWVDEATAALLETRFDVRHGGASASVEGRRGGLESPRTLLGKATPCVGRDKELALLEATWRECASDSVARAVLVTGPAGQGKSRVRHELLAHVTVGRPDAGVLMARADPVGAGSSFLLVRQLVRAAAGLRESAPAGEQDAALRAYVARRCPGADVPRIADFLGALVGLIAPERPSPEMRAAQSDPQVMALWLRRSFAEWIAAECAARPLLVVLEDLHWGDLPSVTYLARALRDLADQPLMVLAFARPEVRDAFPNLWHGVEVQEVPLARLTPRAAERLVRAVLGDGPSTEVVARIVERADGNAFFLEELIRRVAEGGGDALPDSVIALVQSRLEHLDDEARRIVRAASVFGEVFWKGAVGALLGSARDLDAWLESLAEADIIVLAASSRFAGEREYTFRHGLVREVAYSMLTDLDATTAHLLAGQWLEGAGETDSLSLADHFERGRAAPRAVPWLVRAARDASTGGSLDAALALAERGFACGAAGLDGSSLRLVQGTALSMRNRWAEAVGVSRGAMDLAPLGSSAWFIAASRVLSGGLFLGDPSIAITVLPVILRAPVPERASGAYGAAIYMACVGLGGLGQAEAAWSLVDRAETLGKRSSDIDLVFVQHLELSRAVLHLYGGEPGLALAALQRVTDLSPQMANAFTRAATATFSACALAQVGHVARAEEAALEVRKFSQLTFWLEWSSQYAAIAKLDAGLTALAIDGFRGVDAFSDLYLAATVRSALAEALVDIHDLEGARREALIVLERCADLPVATSSAFATLARIELLAGRPAEGLAYVDRGTATIKMSTWRGTQKLLLARAEALHALGRTADARAAIGEAQARIERIAGTIEDPELRASWSTRVVINARTSALAREWLGA